MHDDELGLVFLFLELGASLGVYSFIVSASLIFFYKR